jgi:hypothetical protein
MGGTPPQECTVEVDFHAMDVDILYGRDPNADPMVIEAQLAPAGM